MVDNRAGKHGGKHQNREPDNSVFSVLEYGGFEVCIIRRIDRSHDFKVLGIFFLQNIHRIIYGNDAD